MPHELLDLLTGADFSRLLPQSSTTQFLQALEDETMAKLSKLEPITPKDRFAGFRLIGFHPHGLYVPDREQHEELFMVIRQKMMALGDIEIQGDRELAYRQFQDVTAGWEKDGIAGEWQGQQAMARSIARFRLVAYGRRGGKSQHAAAEAVGLALLRPGFRAWLCAPTMKLVARMWEYVVSILEQNNLLDKCRVFRDSDTSKMVVLPNGSKLEGVSTENVWSMAGEQIDLAIVDEAAQIVEETFTRGILPPLVDRNGQALLISSFEGQGDFFQTKAEQCEKEQEKLRTLIVRAETEEERSSLWAALKEAQEEWEIFTSPSYEINPYAYPQGRQTPILLTFEKQMSPEEFLEQFGAIPAGARERVYSEFQERVHVGNVPFDPTHPVTLTVDPSAGSNPYAVLAIQDYGWEVRVIDEFAETQMNVEKISPILKRREWAPNVRDVIIDPDEVEEVIRWNNLGWPAYACPDRPGILESLPLWRNMLRDPSRYLMFHKHKISEAMIELGIEGEYDDLPIKSQREIILRISEKLNGQKLAPADLDGLRYCARVRIDRRCFNVIDEHKAYSYNKKRKLDQNYREMPKDYKNHTMDALRYFVWATKRFESHIAASDLAYKPRTNDWTVDPEDESVTERPSSERITILSNLRGITKPNPLAPVSMIHRSVNQRAVRRAG